MAKRTGVPVTTMFAFGRGCGKPLDTRGSSPYIQVSLRLEQLGHIRPEGKSERAHCIECTSIIKKIARGFSKAAMANKAPTTVLAKTKTHISTEQSVKSFIENHSKVNPASDDFLSTFEWKATRMMALKKYGPVCQCCGASVRTGAVIHVDHIKPRKIFPDLALSIDNLQILCGDCNGGKGNWDMTDWRGPVVELAAGA